MDNNQDTYAEDVGEVIFAIGALVILRDLYKRRFAPRQEALLVGILGFLFFGIGFFMVFPSGSAAGMWIVASVGTAAAVLYSLHTHPQRAR